YPVHQASVDIGGSKSMAANPLYLHTSSTTLLFEFGIELLESLASAGETAAYCGEGVLQCFGNFTIGKSLCIEQKAGDRCFRQASQHTLDQIALPYLLFKMFWALQVILTWLVESIISISLRWRKRHPGNMFTS